MIAFGTTLMEPILAATQPPITLLVVYVALNEINKRPYDILYSIGMPLYCQYHLHKELLP